MEPTNAPIARARLAPGQNTATKVKGKKKGGGEGQGLGTQSKLS